MEKNDFLAINELIYQIYTSKDGQQLKERFLGNLRYIIRYSYASIMMVRKDKERLRLCDPCCVPADFTQFELDYNKYEGIDHTDWVLQSTETVIIRESEIMTDSKRLTSPIYRQYYEKYRIYDTLQMSIVYSNKVIAVLTLYRTKQDGAFTDSDVFFLRSFSKHLNYSFYSIYVSDGAPSRRSSVLELTQSFGLTRRESEILSMIFSDKDNYEMAENLGITNHTLQKHLQNIYRKMKVSGRIELMKYR
ncbi:MAG: LuxR C-terminal-related transcriptional regulator [Candidatus Ornithomonoglobus sp.]